MYQVGYVRLSELDEEKYVNSIQKECQLKELTSNLLEPELESMDGIIIFHEEDEPIFTISEIILKVKEKSNALIWVVSKKIKDISKIIFLQLGADMTFGDRQSLDEFRLMTMNALKRVKGDPLENAVDDIENNLFKLNSNKHTIKILGKPEIQLTNLEYRVLQLLADNFGNVVTYEEIYESVWQKKYVDKKYQIANIMFHIREKIEHGQSSPIYIKTVRSSGYFLSD